MSPQEEPTGKYNEVLKGLLVAFKPRFEFSLSQVPGFIPAVCQSVFLFDLVILSLSHLPHSFQKPGWNLWETKHNKPFLHHLLLLSYKASLGAENQS